MASAAKKGYGCYLLIGGTRVAEVTNIGEVGPECDSIEITNFDSPDGWREFMGGLKDGGTVGLELNMLPGNASQQAVRSNVGGTGTGTELTYSFVFTGAGETWSCPDAENMVLEADGTIQALGTGLTIMASGIQIT